MTPHALLPLLAQATATEKSTTPYWVTMTLVIAVLGLFIGLVVYAAMRSREQGKHPQMEDDE